ncbi:MAG: fibronectin type III domain-containing protein [Ignavibacteria bacterium]|nr:fibronectin type III domain-containing protein [Ignavibacteria bacterium]
MTKTKTETNNLDNKTALTVFATKGDNSGEINLQWDSVKNATGYTVQLCKVNGRKNWKHFDIVSESFCTINGLKTKQKYLFRVAAINNRRQFPWSNVTEKKI